MELLFAAPYVAGMAGLILSQWPDLTPAEVKARILEAVDDIDSLNPEYRGKLGTGRVSLAKLFESPITSHSIPIKRLELSVFPNPASDVIRIKPSSGNFLTRLRIVNLLGQEVYRQDAPNFLAGSYTLDISELPSGNYFIWAESSRGKEFKKIVKVAR